MHPFTSFTMSPINFAWQNANETIIKFVCGINSRLIVGETEQNQAKKKIYLLTKKNRMF